MSGPISLGKILVVEDDDDHAELLEFAILAAVPTIQVARARDGVEALEMLLEGSDEPVSTRPELVLLDLKLPRMDGVRVLERIKADPNLNAIPAVMLTTSDAATDRARAYAAGVNSYLVKPMGFDELRTMISDTLTYWGRWNRCAA